MQTGIAPEARNPAGLRYLVIGLSFDADAVIWEWLNPQLIQVIHSEILTVLTMTKFMNGDS